MQRSLFYLILISVISNTGFAQPAQQAKLLCHWDSDTNAVLNSYNQRFNDVWGFVQKGKEYAVIGSTWGAHIIDIDNCKEVASAKGSSTGVLHRDFKTYQHYLYAVADEGLNATLQIYDLSYLPDSLHLVYQSDRNDFSRSHSIFIDTAKAKLYCATFNNYSSGHDYMRIYSLADPVNPQLLLRYNQYDDVHWVYARNDTAFCSSSNAGYVVLDCTHLPVYIPIGGLLSYPYQGFNHSSWIGPYGYGVMSDETFGLPLKVLDARDVTNIRIVSNFSPRGFDTTSVAHNPYVKGSFAYISYYQDGFQMYDISNPALPRQAAYYPTFQGQHFRGYAGAWGCYPFLPSRRVLVSDMQHGLYVLDVDEVLNIHKDAEMMMYPNPATTAITIQLPYGTGGKLQCNVVDMIGRRVLSQSYTVSADANPPLTLPLPASMPAGVYILEATVGMQALTARFTKL